jgi:hypothetical protein
VPFIDFSYSPLTSYAFTYGVNLTGKGLYTSSLLDLNGGLKIRFPNKSDWVPYIGLGAGLLRLSSSTYTSGFSTTATVNRSNNERLATSARARFITLPACWLWHGTEGLYGAAQPVRASVGWSFLQFP